VTGRVLEEGTGEGFQGAAVDAFGADGEPLGSILTDGSGRFRFQLSAPAQSFRIQARAFTYHAAYLDSLSVGDGETLVLEDLFLERVPIVLDPIGVEVDRPWVTRGAEWIRQGQLTGAGIFFAGAVLRVHGPPSLTHYIAERTGLDVVYNLTREPFLRSRDAANPCVHVQLNRWPVAGTRFKSLEGIPLETIAAIEVYETYREVPPDFGWDAGRCALVNIWTWDAY
jgi:hypothetical protein